MIDCTGLTAGAPVIACISEQSDYLLGYVILILLVGIIYFRLANEPPRERFTAVLFLAAIITFLGSINNILFPDQYFIVSVVLFLGSTVLLAIRN